MWEKRYAIIQPNRTETNIRFYTDDDLQKLLNISLLNQNGNKISAIADMTDEEIIQEITALSEQHGQVEVDINQMVMAAIDLHEDLFDRVLNSCLLKLGFEKTFCDVIFPLFDKLSVMWQIGRINACQERFITNLVRQKLLVATDGLTGGVDVSRGLVLSFMPTEHENEIGLLYSNYLLRKNKYQVVYLGPEVPFEHIRRIQNPGKFDQLIIGLNHPVELAGLIDYVNKLRTIFPTQRINLIVSKHQKPVPSFTNLVLYSDYEQLSQVLSR